MQPSALDVRWSKWSLLVRSGQGEQSIKELRRIAAVDAHNPLIPICVSRGNSESSITSRPHSSRTRKRWNSRQTCMGGDWRWPAARFDVLDYEGAVNDVQYVLDHTPARFSTRVAGQYLGHRVSRTFTRPRPALRSGVYARKTSTGPTEGMGAHARGRLENVRGRPLQRSRAALSQTVGIESTRPVSRSSIRPDLMQLGKCEEALPSSARSPISIPPRTSTSTSCFGWGSAWWNWNDGKKRSCTSPLYDQAVQFEIQNKGQRAASRHPRAGQEKNLAVAREGPPACPRRTGHP